MITAEQRAAIRGLQGKTWHPLLADLLDELEAAEAKIAAVRSYAEWLDDLAPGDRYYASRIRVELGDPR